MCPRWNPFSGRGVTNCRTGAAEEKRNPKIGKNAKPGRRPPAPASQAAKKDQMCAGLESSLHRSRTVPGSSALRRGERKGHPVVCLMTLLAWKNGGCRRPTLRPERAPCRGRGTSVPCLIPVPVRRGESKCIFTFHIGTKKVLFSVRIKLFCKVL